ncbi:MAG TPA: hypothetical protein VKV15_19765 [Bryobacteraceae bacterium]|nr:hypothetical protein [Bryobacteraceae bacterium]
MKRLLPVLVWTALSSCIFAQYFGGPRSVPNAPGVTVDPGFASRLAATVAGRPVPVAGHGFNGARLGPTHSRRSNSVVVPYPVYVGGGYFGTGYYGGGAYYADPSAAPESAPYSPDPNAQPPVVIINQNFRSQPVNPVMRDYSDTPPGSEQSLKTYENPTHPYVDALDQQQKQAQGPTSTDDEKATIYLLAFKDHTIIPALAYWVDGDALNYITKDGIQNRASLSLIDKDFSKQLNNERHVPFKLPGQ